MYFLVYFKAVGMINYDQSKQPILFVYRSAVFDVMSQRVILEALKEYKGTMIIVSHTEQFIEELNLNKVLFLPEGKFDFWKSEYLSKISED